MKLSFFNYHVFIPMISFKKSWKAFAVLLGGLLFTLMAALYTEVNIKEAAYQDFEFDCSDLKMKLDTRLNSHAQVLRSGAAFFAASDSVTRHEWHDFIQSLKIDKILPGIQGVGYSKLIPKHQLKQHIQHIRNSGFPEYKVIPEGERDIYTSIIYLEPFTGRNLRAFGYDMFSEPTRRVAMEVARDSNMAILSGKVTLVQETNVEIQAGALMYVPVYINGMPTFTIDERRAAIKGWVYSPYRMNDLANGILENWDLPTKNSIHLKIFDHDDISDKTLLYDSHKDNQTERANYTNLALELPIEFNGKSWILQFSGYNPNLSYFHGELFFVIISGIVFSLLLFALSLALIYSKIRAKRIQELNQQLEKLVADKDRFISILAHDLKNPFNGLLGFAELLANNVRTYDAEEIESQSKIIYQSAERIYSLLEDLLSWTRTQSGKLPYSPVKVNFMALCNEVIDRLKINAVKKKITINHLYPEDLYLYADKNMIGTILRNLISNAIKFTEVGGIIAVHAEISDSKVLITISDNGIGMEPEKLHQLFDIKYFQTTEGTAGEIGTGLGLLLCKEFVIKHGENIWVESKIGQGSDFKFTMKPYFEEPGEKKS